MTVSGAENGKLEYVGRGIVKYFRWTAGTVLLITGIAKVVSSFGAGQILNDVDPLIGFRFGSLMFAIGVVELTVAGLCLWGRYHTLAALLVAWLATNFIAYRFGLYLVGWHRPCTCLGTMTDAIRVSPQLADNVMKVVLAYLLVGSCAVLLWRWREPGKNGNPRT